MNGDQLQKFVLAHHGFASALQGHLERLWQRKLTTSEIHTVRSYTLCGSFMSLESIDRGLSLAGTAEEATADFSFMASEVSKHSEDVVENVRRSLGLGAEAPDHLAFPDLLSWEEAVFLWRHRVAGQMEASDSKNLALMLRMWATGAAHPHDLSLYVQELIAKYQDAKIFAAMPTEIRDNILESAKHAAGGGPQTVVTVRTDEVTDVTEMKRTLVKVLRDSGHLNK